MSSMANIDRASIAEQKQAGTAGKFGSKRTSKPRAGLRPTHADLTDGLKTEPVDEPEHDGSWPPPIEVSRHKVTGTLASRIRTALGVTDRTPVEIEEARTYGGYSEYTQENDMEFTVRAGSKDVTFHPDSELTDWHDAAKPAVSDTVFSRFDAWLNAHEAPQKMAGEWMAHNPEESWDRWDEHLLQPDTPLYRAIDRDTRGRVDHIQLRRYPEFSGRDNDLKFGECDFDVWTLDTVAPANERGFRQILNRIHVHTHTIHDESPEGVPDEVIREIADRTLPGRPCY